MRINRMILGEGIVMIVLGLLGLVLPELLYGYVHGPERKLFTPKQKIYTRIFAIIIIILGLIFVFFG